jgi:hypothetical protein
MRNVRPTTQLAHAETTSLVARSLRATDPVELASRATGKFSAQQLIELVGQSAPEDGVVDIHSIENGMQPDTNKHVTRTYEKATVKFKAIVQGD